MRKISTVISSSGLYTTADKLPPQKNEAIADENLRLL